MTEHRASSPPPDESTSSDAIGSPANLLPAVYDRLRRIAGGYLQRLRPSQTIQPTELVHEAFVSLSTGERAPWRTKSHFLSVASKAVRDVLVDHVRARATDKRGGNWRRVTLSTQTPGELGTDEVELLALNDALDKLVAEDERQARIVELRFFGGLGGQEIADLLGLSRSTVVRELRFAQSWIKRELSRGESRP